MKAPCLAFLATIGLAMPVLAQSATQNIALSATVPLSCTISGSTAPSTDSINFGTLGIGASAISATTVYPATAGATGFAVICNSSTLVQLSTTKDGMRNSTAAPSGYVSNINYSASAVLGTATAMISTAGTNSPSSGTQVSNSGPTNSNMVVSVTPIPNTLPLTPGSYSDTLTVTITAQ
jgi:hypothetical protein